MNWQLVQLCSFHGYNWASKADKQATVWQFGIPFGNCFFGIWVWVNYAGPNWVECSRSWDNNRSKPGQELSAGALCSVVTERYRLRFGLVGITVSKDCFCSQSSLD